MCRRSGGPLTHKPPIRTGTATPPSKIHNFHGGPRVKSSKQLRAIACVAFTGLIALTSRDARAAQAALDSACNGSITSGGNLGTGFGAWTVTTVGGGSNGFLTSTEANLGNPGVDLACTAKSWALWAGGGTPNSNYTFDDRPFTAGTTPNASLQSNQTFQVYYENGGVDGTGGSDGFALLDSGNHTNFIFKFTQGGAYTHNGNNTTVSGFTMVGQRIAFTLTSSNTYSLVIAIPTNGTSSVSTMTGSFLTGGTAITKVRFFNNGSGSGNTYGNNFTDMDFFNNMSVTCTNLTVTVSPSAPSACSGGNASFFAAVSAGTSVPIYQWMKGSTPVGNGGTISGANTTNLVLTGVGAGDNGSTWFCIVTNACGAFATNTTASTLTVVGNVSITTQPSSIAACLGSSASFSVVAAGATTYQWFKGTAPSGTTLNKGGTISGATSPTLTYSAVASGDNGASYYVTVTGCGTNVNSVGGVTLTVNTAAGITTAPTAQSAYNGSTATFTVTGSGASPSYYWRKRATGWGSSWTITDTGNAGHAIATAPGCSGCVSDIGGHIFQQYSFNGAGQQDLAFRNFPTTFQPLATGQSFSIDLQGRTDSS